VRSGINAYRLCLFLVLLFNMIFINQSKHFCSSHKKSEEKKIEFSNCFETTTSVILAFYYGNATTYGSQRHLER
jgi:hypothetical protein